MRKLQIWLKYERDPTGSNQLYREPPIYCSECGEQIPRADYGVIQLTGEDCYPDIYCIKCGLIKGIEREKTLHSLHHKNQSCKESVNEK